MATTRKRESARTPEQDNKARIMSHEKQRTYNTLHGLHRALAAAEADIIARKGPDWNKAGKA